MRQYILYAFVAFLIIYALRRDWYVSLCGLCCLTATMGHPDMPRNVGGMIGFNLWNLTFAFILYAWFRERTQTNYVSDAPNWARKIFFFYVGVVVFAYLMVMTDLEAFDLRGRRFSGTFTEHLFEYGPNTIRFVFPAILWFEGTRSRKRLIWGLLFILIIPTYYAYQVFKVQPLDAVLGAGSERARRRISKRIGFHSNSVALCLVAGTWCLVSLHSLRPRKVLLIPLWGAISLSVLGIMLNQSRAGYWAFIGVGLAVAICLYRSMFVILPIFLALVPLLWPGVMMRMTKGMGKETASGELVDDIAEITAGREGVFWDTCKEQIWGSPVIGYGRRALPRTPARFKLLELHGSCPDHPHNAYMQILLEAGIIGFIIVITLLGSVLVLSLGMCWDRRDPLFRTLGGIGLVVTSSWLVMAVSGNSFWPRDNNQMMWCLLGVWLRVWTQRSRMGNGPLFPNDEPAPAMPMDRPEFHPLPEPLVDGPGPMGPSRYTHY